MRYVFLVVVAAIALVPPVAAQGQRMSVQTFLAKVAALKEKGMLAMFSPDAKLLQNEMKVVADEMKADKTAREAAGRPPLACPPADRKKMGSEEFIKSMEAAVPPAQRGIPLKQGFIRMMAAKYPCPR